jgi:hypothetical protein
MQNLKQILIKQPESKFGSSSGITRYKAILYLPAEAQMFMLYSQVERT